MEDQIICPSLEGKTKVSLRGSGMGDLSNISCLLDKVKLNNVPIRRSYETPRLWSTCRRTDLSSSNSSPLSLSKESAAAIKCSAVPRTLDISRRLLSDLALADWFKLKPVPLEVLSPIRQSMSNHRTDTLSPEKNHE